MVLIGITNASTVSSALLPPGALHKKCNSEECVALLSQEGSAARRVARAEVPQANLVKMKLWNLPSHDLYFVSIVLPS
jgi:hypothetical protein